MISKEDLKKQIDDKSKEVSTDSYTLSVSELANRYKDGDITINPKFQRVFRWDCYQKTRFIESLLLKIPIPAIFVSEDQNQKFEIVDGLQRTSTILEFMGYLHDGQDGISIRYPIRKGLIESEYLNLDGTTWDNLDEEWQRRIKNTRITLNIVQKDSDQKTKFDLFNRLNSGGSSLSSQETRNCIMIMIDDTFYDWIEKLSQNLDFIETMNFSEKDLEIKDDMEFVLRYMGTKLYDSTRDKIIDVKDYIDKKTEEISENKLFDRTQEEKIFCALFKKLNDVLGEKAFHKFSNGEFTNRFNYPGFDTIAQGLAYNFGEKVSNLDDEKLRTHIKNLWSNKFNQKTDASSGSSSTIKLKYCADYGKEYFSKIA